MPHRKHPIHHQHITRLDHHTKQTHGYNVRIAWNGAKYGRFFSDDHYGGELGALHAAIAWRTRIEQQIGKPRTERLISNHPRCRLHRANRIRNRPKPRDCDAPQSGSEDLEDPS